VAYPVPDALIFDFDGVIVDSYAAVTGSINAALVDHGMATRPEAALRHFIGPPTYVAFRELAGEDADAETLAALIATYRRHYASVYLTQTHAIEGIAPVLESLSQLMPLAIATSKSVTFTQPLLDALGLERFFVTVAAAHPDDAGDDKTAIVGRAIETLAQRDSRSPAMVGDRSFDVVAARAHGLLSIGVTWGIGSVEELEAAGADVLLAQPGELLELVAADRPLKRYT
jgi:phosphoglycolate phosphatase